ncbi:hypothetical protein ACLEZ9_002555 [Cronobacter sakazakii]
MSTVSNERLKEKRAVALLLTEYKHEDVRLAAQENIQVIDELLALRKEREAAVPVAWRWGYRMSNGEMSQWRLLKVEPGKGSHPDFPRIIEPL